VGYRGEDFLDRVAALPVGTLWRHNIAGDLLRNEYGRIHGQKLGALAEANMGSRGFIYTHHPPEGQIGILLLANARGFTVNISADTLEDADRAFTLGLPTTVILPHDAPGRSLTPGGRRVVVCPAQIEPDVTCASCQLCAKAERRSIVGFRAHGQFKAHVPELVQLRRKSA
jgi:hypothetical protein